MNERVKQKVFKAHSLGHFDSLFLGQCVAGIIRFDRGRGQIGRAPLEICATTIAQVPRSEFGCSIKAFWNARVLCQIQ